MSASRRRAICSFAKTCFAHFQAAVIMPPKGSLKRHPAPPHIAPKQKTVPSNPHGFSCARPFQAETFAKP